MQNEITKWTDFFQGLILTRFRQTKTEAIEVLTSLIGRDASLDSTISIS